MLHLQSYKKDVFIMVISFKGVISRQVGLGVNVQYFCYVYLTPFNSFKFEAIHVLFVYYWLSNASLRANASR